MTERSRGHGKRVTDKDILAAVRGAAEPVTTDTLAERVEIGQREVFQQLRELKEVGELRSKRVGSSACSGRREYSQEIVGGVRAVRIRHSI